MFYFAKIQFPTHAYRKYNPDIVLYTDRIIS